MAFNPEKAMTAPRYGREENRLYIKHPKIGDGQKYYYIGSGVESMDYNISVDTEERNTIAQAKPIIINKAGGMTFPLEFEIRNDSAAYDGLYSMAQLHKVNEEFDIIAVYWGSGVKEDGEIVEGAAFAQSSKAKFTASAIGGAGTEYISITSEGRTDGDILFGKVLPASFTAEPETLAATAFTEIIGMEIGDTFPIRPVATP